MKLNDKQLEAVNHGSGPCLVLAGAGSGKTRVLTQRIIKLVDDGISPYNILAITFTNKAAKEMRSRVELELGSVADSIFIGTFHSFGLRILRENYRDIGYTSNITILDPETMTSIWDPESDLDRDFKLFKACLNYNFIRSCYMYNNPYNTAPIQQVRDAATGMNVLVPTEAQVQELQEDINSIPGCENIDIFTPELPEDFYEYYGYYPDELVNSIWSGNTPEGFEEYYNSLPEDEQDELYATILFE